jgi:hypothetical protein
MTRPIATFAVALLVYLSLISSFAAYMHQRPLVEQLGYTPRGEVLRYLCADQKQLTAASLVLKVVLYLGSVADPSPATPQARPDYPAMSGTLHASVQLDPYNMDNYYLAQAILTWDAGKVDEANQLLEYGMKYRDWDFYLPFFAGFNYAYFQKDYAKAAKYYRRAADLSGQELLVNLAGRYLWEAGQTDLAVAYLSTMEKSARNLALRQSFHTRLVALKQTRRVELAVAAYRRDKGALPHSVQELLAQGYLKGAPVDPYGGTFFLTEQGQVKSTSNFAFAGKK